MSRPPLPPVPDDAPAGRPGFGRRRSRSDAAVVAAVGLLALAGLGDAMVAQTALVGVALGAAGLALIGRSRPPRRREAAVTIVDPDGPQARADFLALAAHEIRTPLAGILGLADLLAETPLGPEQAAYVRAVHVSSGALLRMVDGYLDLSRLEGGHLTPTPVATVLEGVVEDVVELLAPPCQAKGLELATFVAPTLAAPVAVDPQLLRQVLINLTGNAVKFTEKGGVALEVERPDPARPDRVAFRVRDTGIGIDPAEAARIFDAWHRIEGAATAAVSGTGLGLAIARGIVARLGGEIRLDSRPGEGATFSFELDLPRLGSPPLAAPLAGLRVAVVSAAEVEPPLLVRRLHALGAAAELCADPVACGDVDAVLIDHRAEAPADLRLAAYRAAGRSAPAIVLLTPARRADLPALRAAGFAGHLVRPVRTASLLRTLERVVAAAPLDEPEIVTVRSALDVLVVDDDPVNGLLARAALEHAGHRVSACREAASALEAVAAARAAGRPFAAVLMDLHMPDLDGFTAIGRLRASEPEAAPRALVIALTADATPAAADRARACGADATMLKPIDRIRLLERLAALAADPAAGDLAGTADRTGTMRHESVA